MAESNNNPTSIESRIEALKQEITLKDQKRLRLNVLVRVSRRLDTMSLGCETCFGHYPTIDRLVGSIKDVNTWQLPEWKAYYRSLDDIIKHLRNRPPSG